MNNLIFIINVGNKEKSKFKNKGHLKNFVKYLFSCSEAHKENENTQYNFYVKKDIKTKKLNRIGFITNPKQQCEEFLDIFDNEIEDETKLMNDLFYVALIVINENEIITNMIEFESEEIVMSLPSNIINFIAEDYFNGNEEVLEKEINKVLSYGMDKKFPIKIIKDLSIQRRKEIEMLVHSKLINENPNDNVLIEISHHDQEDHSIYHIHRLKRI